ncbi:MAG: hypothetical protein V4719_10610 [Planctomycetota bacterium]
MQRLPLRTRFAVLIPVIAVLAGAVQVWAADAVPAERRLGTDVVAYLSIRNISELKAAWNNTQLGQLIRDKDLAPFLKQFEAPWAKLTEDFEKESGIPLQDILEVPHGEIAIAAQYTVGKPMAATGLLDFGDKRETVDKLLEKMNKSLTDDEAKRSEEEIEGTQVVVYTLPVAESEDADDDDTAKKTKTTPVTICYFIKDTTLVISSRTDALKAILTRWDGQHERIFADKQAFKYIREKCKGENAEAVPHLTFYADPIGLTKGLMALGGADATQSAYVLGLLPSLGLDKLKAFGGTFDMGTDDFDSISRALVYIEPPTSGVLNAFQFPAKNLTPPKWVPANVSTYGAINWDILAAYTTVETLYDTFLGQGALGKVVDNLATQEDGPKIHIKKDIVDQLTGSITIVGTVPEDAEALSGERYLFGLELKEEAPVRQLLEKLADLDGFPGKVREFEGEKIYEMPAAAEDDEEEGGKAYRPAMAITKKQLMFATHVQELEALLRSDADRESLADSEAYKTVAKRFPEQTSSQSFQRSDAQLKMLYDALKGGALTELLSKDDFELDISTLPEFEVLKKYFQPSGGYMIPDERGWFMVGFSLKSKVAE